MAAEAAAIARKLQDAKETNILSKIFIYLFVILTLHNFYI